MDLQQVLSSLERADAAGDTQSAQALADLARSLMAGQQPVRPPPAPAPAPKAGFSLADTALSLGQGVVGAGKSLTDVFGAGNVASEALGRGQAYLGEQMTPGRQAEIAARQAKIKEAEGKGFMAEIGAELGAIPEAPIQSTVQALGSVVPFLATSVVGGVAKLLPATVRIINTIVGAAQGAGAVKGSIYDAVKDKLVETGVPEAKAKEQAALAQEYNSKNALNIVGGAALGGAGARFGVEEALVKDPAKTLSSKFLPRVGKAAAAEAPMEAVQGGQEKAAQNIALQKEGFDVPTFQGVAGRAAGDAALGALAAGAVGAAQGPKPVTPPPPPVPEAPAKPAAPTYEELQARLETLQEQPNSKVRNRQIKAIRTQMAAIPAQSELPETQVPQALEPEKDLRGKPVLPKAEQPTEGLRDVIGAELPATTEVLQDAGIAPTAQELEAAGQQTMDLGEVPMSAPITMADLEGLGGTSASISKANRQWLADNVVGKTPEAVTTFAQQYPQLIPANRFVKTVLKNLAATNIPKEYVSESPTLPKIQPAAGARGRKPSVGVPVQPAVAAGAAPTAGAPAEPSGQRLVPPEQLTGAGAGGQGTQLSALADLPPAPTAIDVPAPKRTRAPKAAPVVTPPAPVDETPAPVVARAPKPLPKPPEVTEATRATAVAEVPKVVETAAAEGETPEEKSKRELKLEEDRQARSAAQKAQREAQLEVTMDDAAKAVREAPDEPLLPEHTEAVDELDAKLNLYDTSEEIVKAQRAAAYIDAVAKNPLTPMAVRQYAQNIVDGQLDPVDIAAGRKKSGNNLLGASERANETPLPPRVLDELKYGSLARALKELGFTAKDPLAKAVAQRLSRLLGDTKVTIVENLTHKDKAYAGLAAEDGSEIQLDSATGLNQEVLLHEAVHAATEHVLGMNPNKWTPQQKAAVMELKSLWEAAKSRPAITLSPDARRSLSEFITEAMTNPDLQVQLRQAKWNSKTLWESFKHDILRLIGVTNPTNMLDYAVAAMDTIFDAPPQVATPAATKQFLGTVAPSVKSLVDGAGDLSAPERSMFTSFLNAFKAVPELDYVTKFRTQTADIAATIENRLRTQFDGKVRDSLGNFNPMGLYRQAQDYSKMMLQFLQTGSIEKEAATGLWKVVAKTGTRAPAKVYDQLAAWSKKNGYSFEEGKKIASRILEGVRLDQMRKANFSGAADFNLHKIDKTSNLSVDQQINIMLAEYNAQPELQEMSKLMDEARIALVDHMITVGRLTPEMGKEWKEVVGYVPFDRMEDFAEKFSKVKRGGSRGLAQVGKLPELKGSFERPVGDVFGNYMNTLGWMLRQVIHTDATVRTLGALQDIGYAKFYATNPRSDHVVSAYVDGELKYWELPSKYDEMAFKDLNKPQATWIQNLGAFSNILRTTVTALPPFALKQVTDDVQRAIVTSGVKSPAALLRMTLTNFPKLVVAELRGIEHPMVKKFGAYGLSGEYDFQQSKPADSLLKDLGYAKRGAFGSLMHKLEGITRASDLAVRAAIYEQTLIESNNDTLLAQTRSREFINFRRRGASEAVGALVSTIPFFNAYVQGMDVLYRAASGKDASGSNGRALARRMFWTRALTVTFISSLYALSKNDDDEYKDMDLRTRDSNWVFPNGYKLPVPGELGAVFKVIPERVVEYMRRQGTVEEQSAFEVVASTLSYMYEQYLGRINPIPQAIKPVLEAWSNKSFLTGRALEGYYQAKLDPSLRRTEVTSELAVAIANFARDELKMEVSPIMIDNTLRGYFGSTAALLTATTDAMLNPDRVDRPLHKWALFSNYMYDPIGTRKVTEFYEQRDKSSRASGTLRELMQTDMTKAAAYAETHMDALALESAVQSTLNQLEQTRAYRKFLNSANGAATMTQDERKSQLEELKKMEVELTGWVREAKTALQNQ